MTKKPHNEHVHVNRNTRRLVLAHLGENKSFHFLIRDLHFSICEMDPKRTTSVFPVLENAHEHTTVFTWECAIGLFGSGDAGSW